MEFKACISCNLIYMESQMTCKFCEAILIKNIDLAETGDIDPES